MPGTVSLCNKIKLAEILKKMALTDFPRQSIEIFLALELVERLKIRKFILESKMVE